MSMNKKEKKLMKNLIELLKLYVATHDDKQKLPPTVKTHAVVKLNEAERMIS